MFPTYLTHTIQTISDVHSQYCVIIHHPTIHRNREWHPTQYIMITKYSVHIGNELCFQNLHHFYEKHSSSYLLFHLILFLTYIQDYLPLYSPHYSFPFSALIHPSHHLTSNKGLITQFTSPLSLSHRPRNSTTASGLWFSPSDQCNAARQHISSCENQVPLCHETPFCLTHQNQYVIHSLVVHDHYNSRRIFN